MGESETGEGGDKRRMKDRGREWEGSQKGYSRSGTYPQPSIVSPTRPHTRQALDPLFHFCFRGPWRCSNCLRKAGTALWDWSRWWVQVAGCRRCQTQPNSVWLTASLTRAGQCKHGLGWCLNHSMADWQTGRWQWQQHGEGASSGSIGSSYMCRSWSDQFMNREIVLFIFLYHTYTLYISKYNNNEL